MRDTRSQLLDFGPIHEQLNGHPGDCDSIQFSFRIRGKQKLPMPLPQVFVREGEWLQLGETRLCKL